MFGAQQFKAYRAALLGAAISVAIGMAAAPALGSHPGAISPELNLVGNFDVPYVGLTTDVWAHGNYAYIGSFDEADGAKCSLDLTGVRVIDISNPANPEQVAFVAAKPGTRNNDVKVGHIETPHFSGDILVVTNEQCNAPFLPRLVSKGGAVIPGSGGISIWDVTDPTKPHAMKQNFLPKANGIHNTFIWQQGEKAYLIAVDDIDTRDVIIVDITKPQSPRVITRTGAPDWPDLDFSEIEGPAIFLHDVWVQENGGQVTAYLSYWDAGLVLLDVTDPANPVFLGDSIYPNPDLSGLPPEGNGHVAVPIADGSLVIFGDEDTTKASAFVESTIGAGPQATNKIGVALFGPLPAIDFFPAPGNVVAVAANIGCNSSDFTAAPGGLADIVLIERGLCNFSEKAANAQAAGYDAYIVFNDAARGDGLINMSLGSADVITIPGIFIGHTLGSAMAAELGASGTVTADNVFTEEDGEGFMRVMDVTDPANMVQVGSFATEGVLPPANAGLFGTRDAHNVVVRDDRAYWAWYFEGLRVVEFSDCAAGDGFEGCAPTEVAHYGGGTDPEVDMWGVYLHDLPANGNTYILGSGRDSGLWIFDVP